MDDFRIKKKTVREKILSPTGFMLFYVSEGNRRMLAVVSNLRKRAHKVEIHASIHEPSFFIKFPIGKHFVDGVEMFWVRCVACDPYRLVLLLSENAFVKLGRRAPVMIHRKVSERHFAVVPIEDPPKP